MKHRKDPNCPVCMPEKAHARQRVRNRKQRGYSPAPRCEAHALKKPRPPAGPGGGSR